MKKSAVVLSCLMVVSLLSYSPQALAQNSNIKQIAPDDALLDVETAGRALLSINAGHANTKLYVEDWRFNDSRLVYQKLSGRTYFANKIFSEKNTLARYCGEDAEQNCDVLQLNKHSKNLIVLAYRHRASGQICVGMDYRDEDISSSSYSRSARVFGNYLVTVGTCVLGGGDAEDAIALGAHYLSVAKRNGRPLANLERYDLPKLASGRVESEGTKNRSTTSGASDTFASAKNRSRTELASAPIDPATKQQIEQSIDSNRSSLTRRLARLLQRARRDVVFNSTRPGCYMDIDAVDVLGRHPEGFTVQIEYKHYRGGVSSTLCAQNPSTAVDIFLFSWDGDTAEPQAHLETVL